MPLTWAERILLLCCGQILARFDRSLLTVSLSELARRLEVDRETGRRHCDGIRQAAMGAIEARQPGRPRRDLPPADDSRAAALHVVNQMLVYLLRELVGSGWHRRLPLALRIRLGHWVCELRERFSLGLQPIADWLRVNRKIVQRWQEAACSERQSPACAPSPDPDAERAQALVASWYWAFRRLPIHRRLSTRAFVALFNRAFAEPLAQLGITRIRRAEASRIERDGQLGRKGQRLHPRGLFRYPAPFQQLTIDTTYVDVGRHRFYLIVLMDVGSRVVLGQDLFLADNTEAVLDVLVQTAARFGVGEFLLIDRGTPYLNERVERWLRARGARRIVCRPASPTEKACLERYNRTFKEWVRPHLDDLGIALLDLDAALRATRLAARIIWQAYNVRPQQFIDGCSPLDRLEQHPLAQAARERVLLALRSVNSAPRRELIAHARQLLQLQISDDDLREHLIGAADKAIRSATRRCAARFRRDGVRNPVGYFIALVRTIDDEQRLALARSEARKESSLHVIARQQAKRERLAARRHREVSHPETAVWSWLVWLLHALGQRNRYLARLAKKRIAALLVDTRAKLGPALFEAELAVITDRLSAVLSLVPPEQPTAAQPVPAWGRETALKFVNEAGRRALEGGG